MTRPVGVILAAGKATRIWPLNVHSPKALLSVGNRPIILSQIEEMRRAGVERVIVVVGNLKERLIHALGDGGGLGVEIQYVEQEEQLGIAHALAQVEGMVDGPFFVVLGDIYSAFTPGRGLNDLLTMYERGEARAVLTVKAEANPEVIRHNFAVITEGDRVVRVVEKPRTELPTDQRGCGIYLFDPDFFEAIARTPRSEIRNEYELTDAIQTFIESGAPVGSTSIIDWDMNMTFPRDLLACNIRHLDAMSVNHLVGAEATVPASCSIVKSVLGARVVIPEGIRITHSLIFPDVRIERAEDIQFSVVSAAGWVECQLEPM